MDDLNKIKLAVLHETEQLRAEFDEFWEETDDDFKLAILDAAEEEQTRPEMMAIVRMAKLLYFEKLLAMDPPNISTDAPR